MGRKQIIQGTVVSDKMDKTVVVSVARRKKHPLYRKVITATKHYKAHDEANTCRVGDEVRIIESRPMSKAKRWRVFEVLTQGDVAEIAPDTIGRELESATQIASKREEAEAESAEASDEDDSDDSPDEDDSDDSPDEDDSDDSPEDAIDDEEKAE